MRSASAPAAMSRRGQRQQQGGVGRESRPPAAADQDAANALQSDRDRALLRDLAEHTGQQGEREERARCYAEQDDAPHRHADTVAGRRDCVRHEHPSPQMKTSSPKMTAIAGSIPLPCRLAPQSSAASASRTPMRTGAKTASNATRPARDVARAEGVASSGSQVPVACSRRTAPAIRSNSMHVNRRDGGPDERELEIARPRPRVGRERAVIHEPVDERDEQRPDAQLRQPSEADRRIVRREQQITAEERRELRRLGHDGMPGALLTARLRRGRGTHRRSPPDPRGSRSTARRPRRAPIPRRPAWPPRTT